MTDTDSYFRGVVVDASGLIKWSIVVPVVDACLQTVIGVEEFIVEGEFDKEAIWFPNGPFPEMRPVFTETTEFEIVADGVAEIVLPLIAATQVIHLSQETDARGRERTMPRPVKIEGERFVFSETKAGVYKFRLKPPAPYRHQTIVVTAHAPK